MTILKLSTQFFFSTLYWIRLKSLLAWPFTILQNDNITISWDFLRLTAPAARSEDLGAVSLKKSHGIVILSFCNIVKGQANCSLYLCSLTISFDDMKGLNICTGSNTQRPKCVAVKKRSGRFYSAFGWFEWVVLADYFRLR